MFILVAEEFPKTAKAANNFAWTAYSETGKTAVRRYMHALSFNLKKTAQRVGMKALFSAVNKVANLSGRRTSSGRRKKIGRVSACFAEHVIERR